MNSYKWQLLVDASMKEEPLCLEGVGGITIGFGGG